jgi:hypothetical protein
MESPSLTVRSCSYGPDTGAAGWGELAFEVRSAVEVAEGGRVGVTAFGTCLAWQGFWWHCRSFQYNGLQF